MPDERFERYRRKEDWIQRYIFPGSLLPSLKALQTAISRASGLMVVGLEEMGRRTTQTRSKTWRERFFTNLPEVRALGFDDRFIRHGTSTSPPARRCSGRARSATCSSSSAGRSRSPHDEDQDRREGRASQPARRDRGRRRAAAWARRRRVAALEPRSAPDRPRAARGVLRRLRTGDHRRLPPALHAQELRDQRPTPGGLGDPGSMAMQGPLTQWVTDHRKHHALSDRPGDPHSPHAEHGDSLVEHVLGLWHSHIGWLFSTKGLERVDEYGRDLYEDPLVRGIDRLYLLWVALTLGLPFLAGYLVGGSWQRGLEAMVWAGLVRIFLFQHVTFSINSICHFFGEQPFRTRDESRNVWLLAIPSFGESWHNGHHAFPASAVHGLQPGQLDISALVIRGMGNSDSRPRSSALTHNRYSDDEP